MSATSLIEFDDATEHTFDASFLELLSDKGQLKSQVDPNEVLFSNFDTDADAVSKRGAKTLVFEGVNNNASVVGGLLTFLADRSLATYKNITNIVDDFAFRCRIQAIIATTSQDRDLFSLKSNNDTSEIRFFFSNHGSGITRMNAQMVDSVGGITNSVAILIKDMAIDPNWNVAISNDDDGNILFFIDGVLLATIVSPAFDFTDMNIIFGDNSTSNSAANFDNVQLFKSNAITTAFAFPFPEDTTFNLNENTMLTTIPFLLDEVIDFSVIEEIPADTQLKHFLVLNLTQYYHDGAAWAISDGTLAQSNTAVEIKNNLATLPIVKGIGTMLQIAHIFKSDIGYATSVIESLTIKYKFQFKPDEVRCCLVFGTILDNAKNPVVGATIRVDSEDKFYNGALIGASAKVITNAQGKFSIGIVETATDNTTVDIFVEYVQKKLVDGVEEDENVVFEYEGRIIPDLPTCKLSDLLTV